jgi:thioredoxin reductase (NADPH)
MHARKLVVATGYYDRPNMLDVPGESLPFVSHYFTDPHPFWRQDVVVIGAKNSAAEAALDLFRGGANVTLVHRDAAVGKSLKYWVKPDIENRIKAGQIKAIFNCMIKEFIREGVLIEEGKETRLIPAKHVFALTGYHPDFAFIESLGVRLDKETRKPELNPETLESNVKGIYLAGVVIGGRHTGEIFIENGRFHGKQIVEAMKKVFSHQ